MRLPALEKRIARHRAQDERIVRCHGCFDVVHPGFARHPAREIRDDVLEFFSYERGARELVQCVRERLAERSK